MDVFQLNRLARRLREIALRASQEGAELPISVGELAILEHVARFPGSTISEISRSTGLAQSRVSKVVRELSDDGVFQHAADPEDRRRTRVRLDPRVRHQTFDEYGSRPIDAALAAAAPHLDAAGLARVQELAAELAGLLTPQPAADQPASTR
ncbi:MarR family winged helix-turn-helix transcriptional regulator [Paractinoplanes rhizophilus]|uniref:MarR family winged helix-turn-helix transcriptional regulator n=1 Tax=Paractinoplanes rhizophilus TaxID=1416877 RepID=A0ABW2HP14_9ACTN